MSEQIEFALSHILKRFKGMIFDTETLSYLEIEVNDMIFRLYPQFGKEFHLKPIYKSSEKKIKFDCIRKQ